MAKSNHLPSNVPEDALPAVFSDYFIDKIVKIRNEISFQAKLDTFREIQDNILPDTPASNWSSLSEFAPANEVEVESSSSCNLDPVPTWLLKECLSDFLPVLTETINLSLTNSDVLITLKRALVKPLLKKASLDPDILKNYRPISNLSFISKLVERLVARRLNDYLAKHYLLDRYQSAYRKFHSTESALLRVQNDILSSLHDRKMVVLAMLDLSAAFDTIDHNILFTRLQSRFGIYGSALN